MIKMLCALCAKIFAFDRADRILGMKEKAIRQAVEHNLDAVQIKRLQSEYERYRDALESRRTKSPFPSPWDIAELVDIRFPVDESYHEWQLEKRRHWHELKKSAASSGCGLCERLVAMIQHQTTTSVPDLATITCMWFLGGGSLTPQWLRFDVHQLDYQSSLMMRFHIAIDTGKPSKSALKYTKYQILILLVLTESPTYIDTTLPNSTKNDACLKYLSRSLQRCLTHHKSCFLEKKKRLAAVSSTRATKKW